MKMLVGVGFRNMKAVVIGNCQARPLGAFLTAGCPNFSVEATIVNHLAENSNAPAAESFFRDADLILVQRTSDDFPVEHARSVYVKQRYPEKTLVWPNLFYSGQTPYCRYMTHKRTGRVMGPLDAYHDIEIFGEWSRMRGVPVLQPLANPEEILRRSFLEFKEREGTCDVQVSDIIARHEVDTRLFFTFNHPSRFLLKRLCQRICEKVGLAFNEENTPVGEPLARIIPPSSFRGADLKYFGLEVHSVRGMHVELGGRRPYSLDELKAKFFEVYDAMSDEISDLSALRFTPQMV